MPTVSADVERLQRRLASGRHRMELPPNIVADLSRVTRALYRLQAVLPAAEKRPFEESREHRLRKIKQDVYDVEGVLDDLEDGSIRGRKLQEGSNLWSQAVFFFSLSHSVLHCRIVKKMKKIRKSLDHASEDSFIFNLVLHHRDYGDRTCDQGVFDKTSIIGRDNDKENLRALVLSNSEENFSIIPIVGLGGLGKTVLAQLIFSDKDVRDNFDLHIWINLNMSCNLNSIASKIISEANRTEEDIEDNPQIIMNCLRKVLNKKRCLIVLDGLWSTDEGQLLHLKKMLRGTTENTKIIVTTCSENVAKLLHTIQPYKLGPLSAEHCWTVFSQRVFCGRVNSDLTRMGRQIVNMCDGIPAVAQCLGSLVHDKGMSVWNDEKESMWKLEKHFPIQVNLFSSIKQIYYNMPSALKSCLNHLSMFPKGSVIRMENLIRQWAALGILGSTHGSFPVYSQGKKYINELLSVFFLEEPNKSSGSGLNYASASMVLSMHNLVHEFARYVTSHDLFTMDGERKNNDSTEICNSRYASLTRCNEESKIHRVLLTSVRAICLKDCAGAKLIEKIFSALKHLHVLDISRCSFKEIPSSICQLTHLRYIDISSSAIQSLPHQMSFLQNLEALDLSETCVLELPDFVGTFHKLKYLNLQGCRKLHHLSSKLDDIKSLQHLNLSCCPAAHQLLESISGFQELCFLDISSCTELQILPESFGRLTNLEDLVLSNCTKLKKLPESFGELCFLRFLNVSGCCELEELPASLGRLASLEVLILSGCSRIQSLPQSLIDIEFLQILDLAGCVDLHMNLGMLPNNNLENLNVDGCRKIYAMPGWTVNFPKLHPKCLQSCDQQIITEKQVCPSHSCEVEISKELNVPVHDEIEEAMANQSCQQAGNSECSTKEVVVGSSARTSHKVSQRRTTPSDTDITAGPADKAATAEDRQSSAVIAASRGGARTGPAPAVPVPRWHRSQLHKAHGRRTGSRKLQSEGTSSSSTRAIGFACWPRKTQKHFNDVPAKEDEGHPGQVKKFSFWELQDATDNFSKRNIIGRGAFGTTYKGMLTDGSLVAVKRKEERTHIGELQFQTEVEILSMVIHRNVLRLHGFCKTRKEMLLVYEYMANGSVGSRLRERRPISEPPLDWQTRRRIALGSARGLSYLHDHCDPKIIHGDVKTANILLDEDFEAVLGDFGLAKLMDNCDTDITIEVPRTIGNIAPEFILTGQRSDKTDVFSYGIMLLELVTGQLVFELTRVANDENASVLEWVKVLLEKKQFEILVDDDLNDNYIEDEVESLIQIVLLCTQSDPVKRPKMSEVVRMLDGDGGLAERWEWKKLKSTFNLGTSSSGTRAIGFPSLPPKTQKLLSNAKEDQEGHLGQVKKISLRELQVATNNFSKRNIVGRGAFGKIYKGMLADGSLVAVKRKEQRTHIAELHFQTEVEILSMVIHRNVLRLHGFCKTRKEMLLVYEYMANGSVGSRLRERPLSEPPLDWQTRRRIALGSARGLSYLHDDCDKMIIHGDVKAANILLDEDFEAVVGDFGLAKIMDNDDTEVRGTVGHIAPEYFSTGKSSDKTDVFSYGIMLLELVTGQRAFELARAANDDNVCLHDWVKVLLKRKILEILVDNDLNDNYNDDEVESLIQIALLCTQSDPVGRPKMSEVVRMLEGDGGLLAERWDELKNLEGGHQEVELSPPRRADWIEETAYDLRSVELSGPR